MQVLRSMHETESLGTRTASGKWEDAWPRPPRRDGQATVAVGPPSRDPEQPLLPEGSENLDRVIWLITRSIMKLANLNMEMLMDT